MIAIIVLDIFPHSTKKPPAWGNEKFLKFKEKHYLFLLKMFFGNLFFNLCFLLAFLLFDIFLLPNYLNSYSILPKNRLLGDFSDEVRTCLARPVLKETTNVKVKKETNNQSGYQSCDNYNPDCSKPF